MSDLIVDLFAGPGGWDEGLRSIGLTNVVGLEWDEAACKTRAAAGHRTIRCDVAEYPTAPFVGETWGLIASPPCQEFSTAGAMGGADTERGALVYEVLRWADALRPEWIACEQVPLVLPIWKMLAQTLAVMGYGTWAGMVNAADYGVPQTRKRAYLIASRRAVTVPEPTHASAPAVGLFGALREPWRTMQDALGWRGFLDRRQQSRGPRGTVVPVALVATDRPAPTVTGAACAGQWVLHEQLKGKHNVTPAEGGVLQGFPADYPWHGTQDAQAQQVGNAVPPRLAAAVVGALVGVQEAAA